MQALQKILLVDDNQFNNYLNRNLIRDLNLAKEIQIVHNGLEALKLLQEYSNKYNFPELILLDLVMPTLDGVEFLNIYNSINFHKQEKPKVVVLTSVENEEEIAAIRKLGVEDIIFKPLTGAKIIQVIKKYFQCA